MMKNSPDRTMVDSPAVAFAALWREYCETDGKVDLFVVSIADNQARLLRFFEIFRGIAEDKRLKHNGAGVTLLRRPVSMSREARPSGRPYVPSDLLPFSQ